MFLRDLTVYSIIMAGVGVSFGFAWFMREIVFDELLPLAAAALQ